MQTTLDIIIPVYNEELAVVQSTIETLLSALSSAALKANIIVVNDGSKNADKLAVLADDPRVSYLSHPVNRGYGAALKTGIRHGQGDYVAITDADGTYPIAEIPRLFALMKENDMVVGARIGQIREIPWLRRFPKALLNMSASYLAGQTIKDLNSGLRIFRRELALKFWDFFPNGFSFTSTITMGSVQSGYRVQEVAIDYFKREGQSSIHPIKDTIRFFKIVFRLGLLFTPMRIFLPVASALFAIGAVKGLGIDYFKNGYVGTFSGILMLTAVQIFMLGLLGQLIVLSRLLSSQDRPR